MAFFVFFARFDSLGYASQNSSAEEGNHENADEEGHHEGGSDTHGGDQEHHPEETRADKLNYYIGKIADSEREIFIPFQLMKLVHNVYVDHMMIYDEVRAVAAGPKKIVENINRKFLSISVKVYDEANGAIVTPTRFVMPRGGGVIDLKEVMPQDGSAWVRFKVDLQAGRQKKNIVESRFFKAYYVSDAQKREIDGDQIGLGCGKFVDVTDYFKRVISKEGMVLQLKKQEYLSLVGGIFLFVFPHEEDLFLGSLGIIDSRWQKYQCRILRPEG